MVGTARYLEIIHRWHGRLTKNQVGNRAPEESRFDCRCRLRIISSPQCPVRLWSLLSLLLSE